MRQVDPEQRGFGQTPVQRRPVPARLPELPGMEDRLQNILDFSPRPNPTRPTCTSPAPARGRRKNPCRQLRPRRFSIADLEKEFGKGAVARPGSVSPRTARAAIRASPKPKAALQDRDFAAPTDAHPRKGAPILGNDQATPVTEVGTFRCRALHSNHMAGHLYMEYGNGTLRARPVVADIPEADAIEERRPRRPTAMCRW